MSTPGNNPPQDPWGGQGGQPPHGPPQPPASEPTTRWEDQYPQVPPPGWEPPPTQYAAPGQSNPYEQATQLGQSNPYGQPSQYPPGPYPPNPYEQPNPYGANPYSQGGPPPFGGPGDARRTSGGNGRKYAIIGLVVVLVAGLLAGGYFVFLKKDAPALTFAGKKINTPESVLTAAEANLAAIVKTRSGVAAADTRCYFAVPRTPAAGAKKSDVDSALRCGPVLFVDGDASQSYLSFALTAGAEVKGAVTLTAAKTARSLDPQQVSGALTLERPDKLSAPAGSGGLTVPAPPPTTTNFLGRVPLGNSSVPAAPATAVIGAKNGGVRLATLGPIDRYGTGDTARSAADGQKLVAFTVGSAPTASGGASTLSSLVLRVVVNGGTPRLLPGGSNPIVVAVPTTATDASLQVVDAGITQTISLLTGKPGAGNVLVGQRRNHFQTVSRSVGLNWRWSASTGTINRPSTLRIGDATLSYWGLTTSSTNAHPASPAKAFLSVDMTYTYGGPPTGGFTAPGGLGPFGLDPAYLSLQLPNGAIIKAKDVSANRAFVYDVFEVPAGFTTGTVLLSGSTRNSNGLTFTVTPIVRIPISIAAG